MDGVQVAPAWTLLVFGLQDEKRGEAVRAETALRAASARRAAEEAHAVFVPLQRIFDDACRIQPPAYWLADGVHPTPAGHQLIANEWLRAFASLRPCGGDE